MQHDDATEDVGFGFTYPERRLAREPSPPSDLGRIAAAQGRKDEEVFISSFLQKLAALPGLRHPQDGHLYTVSPQVQPIRRNARKQIERLSEQYGKYPQEFPQNSTVEVPLMRRKILGHPEIKMFAIAACLTPLVEWLTQGEATTPLNQGGLETFLRELAMGQGIYYYLGLFSPTGWAAEIEPTMLAGENWAMTLARRGDSTRWHFLHADQSIWSLLTPVFDPESAAEKRHRVQEYLQQHGRLAVRGGFLALAEARAEVGVSEEIFLQGVQAACARDGELSLEEVGGLKILKRKRF